MSPRYKPLGLRREVILFLPLAVLLLIIIASFNGFYDAAQRQHAFRAWKIAIEASAQFLNFHYGGIKGGFVDAIANRIFLSAEREIGAH